VVIHNTNTASSMCSARTHTLAEGLVVDDIMKQDRLTAMIWNLIYLMNLFIASTVNLKFNPWSL